MNKTFCAYPFVHSHVSATYDRKICCISPAIPDSYKTPTTDFWNSEYVRDVRLDMIMGKEISGCEYCYNFEKNGGRSLRIKVNEEYDLKQLIDHTDNTGYLDLDPSFYDVRSTVCNFQCITCDENHSSMHKKLSVKLNTSSNNHKVDSEYEKTLSNEIIQSLIDKKVKILYWAGGEPMIMKLHWDVLDKMVELLELPEYHDYIKSIQLYYNTNLSKLYYKNKYIPEILAKFDTIIWASLDGVQETHNYCRDGSDWTNVYSNWLEYKKYVPKLSVASVLTAPVLMDIERYIEFLYSENCVFFDHEYLPIGYNKLLDIKLYPDELFYDIINNAKHKLLTSNLDKNSIDNSVTILNKYVDERDNTDIDYANIKKDILVRDKFMRSKLTFGSLLECLNNKAYTWYNSIATE